MKSYLIPFFDFINEEFKNKKIFLFFIFLALLIAANYHFDLETIIRYNHYNTLKGWIYQIIYSASIFLFFGLVLEKFENIKKLYSDPFFWKVLLSSMVVLATYRIITPIQIFMPIGNDYFTYKLVSQLNLILIVIFAILFLGVYIGKSEHKIYGLLQFKFESKIYFIFLGLMLPLLLWAATQPDFLAAYPKLKENRIETDYFSKFFIYEPFYLLNFIGIEWLYRGFLILAFAKFFGRKSVILIAVLYCVLHFGKPLAECISSFFGGYILGYMAYKTKVIWGGIIVHMGIAFLMDIFAFFSILWF